jgi:Polyketide cyclase / dehydrase and lipid transport
MRTDSDEIRSIAHDERRIRFERNDTLNRKVNGREQPSGARHERFSSQVFHNISMKFLRWVNVTSIGDRLPICGLFLSLLVVGNLRATEWQEVSKNYDLAIYTRHRPGSPIEEVRGIGEFNARISVLKGILADVAKYSEFMPYTKESRVLPQDAQLCYMVLRPPLVGSLDYTIRVHEELVKNFDGSTSYHSRWELDNPDGPPPRPGITRVTINEGSWLLEPVGNQTRATYTLYTDGGGIPPLLMNLANKLSVSRLFDALRARMRDGE